MGRTVVLERVPDYWGGETPHPHRPEQFRHVMRTEYYRDSTVALEAFKAGQLDWTRGEHRQELGHLLRLPGRAAGPGQEGQLRAPPARGHAGFRDEHPPPHLRRPPSPQGAHRPVRLRMDEQESLLRKLCPVHQLLTPTATTPPPACPPASELAHTRAASATACRPSHLHRAEFKLPVTDGSGNNRPGHGLRPRSDEAGRLVHRRSHQLVNAQGQQFAFEILLNSPSFERVALPYVQILERLGIAARVRTVDPSPNTSS